MNIFFVSYFLCINRKRKIRDTKFGIPWQLPFIILTVSMFLSSIFAVAGLATEISAFVKYLFENVLLIWVVWETLRTDYDFKFIFKLITVVMFASCIYGLIEFVIGMNPLQLYEATLNHDPSKQILFTYGIDERGYRVNSIFEHAIGAGVNWSLYAGFVLYYIINKKRKLPYHMFAIITACLCILCVLLTKMRSPLAFAAILCFGAFNFKKKRTYFFSLLIIMVLALFLLTMDESSDIFRVIFSMLSLNTTSSVGGSSFDMRIKQLGVAFNLMKMNPLVGLGTKYQSVISGYLYSDIYGSEGLLLYVLPSFGIIGLLSYGYYFFFSAIRIPKYFKSKQLAFLFLAYLITWIFSSLPGMKISLLYLFAFYLIKSSKKYESSTETRKVAYREGKFKKLF